MPDQTRIANRFEEFEDILSNGIDFPDAIKDTFSIKSIGHDLRRVKFSYGGLFGVDLRQVTNRPEQKDVIVSLASGSIHLGIGLRHDDGYLSFQAGGMFAVLPNGEFSNRFGFSHDCNEHGPLTATTEQELMNIALGRVMLSTIE